VPNGSSTRVGSGLASVIRSIKGNGVTTAAHAGKISNNRGQEQPPVPSTKAPEAQPAHAAGTPNAAHVNQLQDHQKHQPAAPQVQPLRRCHNCGQLGHRSIMCTGPHQVTQQPAAYTMPTQTTATAACHSPHQGMAVSTTATTSCMNAGQVSGDSCCILYASGALPAPPDLPVSRLLSSTPECTPYICKLHMQGHHTSFVPHTFNTGSHWMSVLAACRRRRFSCTQQNTCTPCSHRAHQLTYCSRSRVRQPFCMLIQPRRRLGKWHTARTAFALTSSSSQGQTMQRVGCVPGHP
jgi:hypothetical protein